MSVHSVPHLRLPDQVTIDFGPAEVLGPAFLALDRAVRERGIYLSLSDDMDELAEVNARNRKDWYPLPPMFDSALGGLNEENAFWIRGVNDRGEVVLTQAARLYVWPDTSLHDELESMRLFYPDPEVQRGPDEACVVDAPSAADIAGRVCYTGVLWFRPDYRGAGLASVMPRLTRACATARWFPDYTLSLVKTALVARGMARTYGWRNVDRTVRWFGSREGGAALEFAVGWMDSADVVDDIEKFTALLTEPLRLSA